MLGRCEVEPRPICVFSARHRDSKSLRKQRQHLDAQASASKQAEITVLGIETSCDETAAGIVTRDAGGRGRILSNVLRSQWQQHQAFGGVVPEIAARAHVECLDSIIGQAMQEAGIRWDALDAVAATAGPGLIGGLIVGLTTAKAIAL